MLSQFTRELLPFSTEYLLTQVVVEDYMEDMPMHLLNYTGINIRFLEAGLLLEWLRTNLNADEYLIQSRVIDRTSFLHGTDFREEHLKDWQNWFYAITVGFHNDTARDRFFEYVKEWTSARGDLDD